MDCMKRDCMRAACLALVLAAAGAYAESPAAKVAVSAGARSVGRGRPVAITATARLADGKPAVGWRLLPYVNGARWGSHETADAQGKVRFLLPLPRPGTARLCVAARKPLPKPEDYWIWPAPAQGVVGVVYLQRVFSLPQGAKSGTLWLAVDDSAIVYLNGVKVAEKGGWHDNAPVALAAAAFRRGENVLSVEANNGAGPCGLLLRLTAESSTGETLVVTNDQWLGFTQKPDGWPAAVAGGEKVGRFGDSASGVCTPEPWPTLGRSDLIAGTPLAQGAAVSNEVTVEVRKRALQRPPTDPDHLVCVQWEEWFTPQNCYWQTAQGVPLMGFYDSSLRDVARQHLIWFIESGVDAILADWSNHIWQAKSWDEIGPGSKQLLATSALMMDEMAAMRAEGYAAPKMTFLGGISYARPEGPEAVNGELRCVWDDYVANPKYKGLWQHFDGKPLMELLDCSASYLKERIQLDDRFTIRFVGSPQDVSKTNELGLWSWMDWQYPAPTRAGGVVEAETVSTGSFGGEGWLGATARGHRNGATLIEDFNVALRDRPRFLHLHQFNEFAGQPEGAGYGPEHNRYVDSYSADLCDDIEPTSMTAPAYRSDGGWGYYYLNLIRALVDLYRQPTPETTVLAISEPTPAAPGHSIAPVVKAGPLTVKWVYAGRRPATCTLTLDGKVLAERVTGEGTTVDLKGVGAGRYLLRLTAEGTKARYRLSWTEDSLPLATLAPAFAEVPITIEPANH
ncbi:MAG: hypothetical protein COS65_14365 [Armatimonadetes bacterium CG06_land_8_20_14_3_00_66_21]|nr:MAG: hypothetical protein COS65_14365 [Armatimonadetes bacterium CG06_land_8_20_14_3_00_66_21]